ncbi:MAG TPA: PrsW family intramembrane metalloprotease [Actinomycetota bacterium]|jgi:RsiW-degrading membrane proteinase PrsW (M82 family)|nr:PrsW family intramembrane metalloprotease [Actinomycetota bacterium]
MAPDRRALHHRSIFQFHQPAFWVFAAFLLYGVVRMVAGLGQLASVSRSGWALSWLLLLMYAAPLVLLIYYLDLYEREPVSVAIAAFLWGAFAATALALDAGGWDVVLANLTTPGFALRWGPTLTAPVIEEFLKGAGLVLLYLIVRDEVDDMMDGFVYGALCGLGFAVVEDVVYFMAGFGGTPSGVLEGFYVRVVSSGLYGHVLYTGLVGMAIGLLVTRRDPTPMRERLPVAAGIVVLAVLGHALWNAPVLALAPSPPVRGAAWLLYPLDLAIKGLPLLLFVIVALRLARDRERRWLDGALAAEVGLGGVTAGELVVLRAPVRRRAAVRAMRARAGDAAGRLLGRLQREQVDLAMVASRVTASDAPELVAQRQYCVSLRAALDAMPGAAAAAQRGG